MDENIIEAFSILVEAIRDGGLNIDIYTDNGTHQAGKSDNSYQLVPDMMTSIQSHHLDDYLREEHPTLSANIISSLLLCNNGELLIDLTTKGFKYYLEHKESIYEAFQLKAGVKRVHIIVPDEETAYVQNSVSVVTKNMGQVPAFGTSSLDDQDDDQDDVMSEAVKEPLIPFKDIFKIIPKELAEAKVSYEDIIGIHGLLHARTYNDKLESLEDKIIDYLNTRSHSKENNPKK
jgi:hypothetical protein